MCDQDHHQDADAEIELAAQSLCDMQQGQGQGQALSLSVSEPVSVSVSVSEPSVHIGVGVGGDTFDTFDISSRAVIATAAAAVNSEGNSQKHPIITCSVCLCNLNASASSVVTLPCGHVFHQACISPWLDQSTTCPECRNAVHGGSSSSRRNNNNMLVHSVQAIVNLIIEPILTSFGGGGGGGARSTDHQDFHGDNFRSIDARSVSASKWMFMMTAWVVGIVALIVLSDHTRPYSGYSLF